MFFLIPAEISAFVFFASAGCSSDAFFGCSGCSCARIDNAGVKNNATAIGATNDLIITILSTIRIGDNWLRCAIRWRGHEIVPTETARRVERSMGGNEN